MLKPFQILDRYLGISRRFADRPKKASGVLLISSGGIGDTILFSVIAPRFAALARPGEPLYLIVRSDSRPVTFLFPPEFRIIPIDYRRFMKNPLYRLGTCRTIGDLGCRLAVSTDHLRHPLVDDVLVRASDADQRLAMEPRSWPKHDAQLRKNLADYSRLLTVTPGMAHRLVRWVELADWALGRTEPVPVVRLPAGRLPVAEDVAMPPVVLHPFSAIRERQYGVETFRKIIGTLPGDTDIILSAGPDDLGRNPEFRELLEGGRVRLDERGLREKAALLRSARLVVSIDTSIMHLAVVAGAPTLCLASPAHVIDSIPYDPRMMPKNVRFLYHDMDCRGCLGQCIHPLADGRYRCIAEMDDETILTGIRELLD